MILITYKLNRDQHKILHLSIEQKSHVNLILDDFTYFKVTFSVFSLSSSSILFDELPLSIVGITSVDFDWNSDELFMGFELSPFGTKN